MPTPNQRILAPAVSAAIMLSGVRCCFAMAVLLVTWRTAMASDANPGSTDQASTTTTGSDPVRVQHVRGHIYMLTVAGRNLAVQAGPDGVIVVNTGPKGSADAVLKTIKALSANPIRFVIDTSADTDIVANNEALAAAGSTLAGGRGPTGAPIVAHENVLQRMISTSPDAAAYPAASLPGEPYEGAEKSFYLNGEAIEVLWQSAAHSDGDSVVRFPRSDVVVTGDVFDMVRFPVIDVVHGGGIQGEVHALNHLLDLVIPVTPMTWREGENFGTLVIPARGRVCDQVELVQYRDMVTIIRDRVAALMKAGKSIEEVKDARPAAGYESRFGSTTGEWTTDMFVEAIYKSLKRGTR